MIALMMEAARTSETLVNFYQTTRRYNPEDSHHQDNTSSIEKTQLAKVTVLWWLLDAMNCKNAYVSSTEER
jgi:hypothetical protein